jgi:hypothetical protein
MRRIRFIFSILIILVGLTLLFSQDPDPIFFNEKHEPIEQKFSKLKLGEIRPEGCLKDQMDYVEPFRYLGEVMDIEVKSII